MVSLTFNRKFSLKVIHPLKIADTSRGLSAVAELCVYNVFSSCE